MRRRDEVTVGVLITAAVVVLILGTLWLAHGGLSTGYSLYTRFAWGQELKQGQPVLLAGVGIGYVSDVTLRRDGHLDVVLHIDNKYTVPKGSTTSVKPVGIFGDVAVGLNPPTPVPAASYAPGDTLPTGPPATDVAAIMNHTDSITVQMSQLLRALQTEVVEAGTLRDIHKMMTNAAAVSVQLQSVVAEQNRNFTETMAAFRADAERVTHLVDSAQVAASMASLRQTSENAARLSANLDSTNADFRRLIARLQRPDGTVGKLLTDSLLYSRIVRLVTTSDSLLADFKANPKKYINVHVF